MQIKLILICLKMVHRWKVLCIYGVVEIGVDESLMIAPGLAKPLVILDYLVIFMGWLV